MTGPKIKPHREPGVLPDGIRGTTDDIPATVPQDEHAGFPDPAKPDTRAPAPKPDADRT